MRILGRVGWLGWFGFRAEFAVVAEVSTVIR
jgi:hypothetical protein